MIWRACGVVAAVVLGGVLGCLPGLELQVTLEAPDCVPSGVPVGFRAQAASPVSTWRWDFGDGSPALITRTNALDHRYAKAGSYAVLVTAEALDGRTGHTGKTVRVEDVVSVCGEEHPPEPTRLIQVDACLDDGVKRCFVDVGAIPAGTTADAVVAISNVGTSALRVDTVRVGGSVDGAFQLVAGGSWTLEPGQVEHARVRLTPVEGHAHQAWLGIHSNAQNTPGTTQELRVLLSGHAPNAPLPHMRLDPVRCDFGQVAVEDTGVCTVQIHNDGNAPLLVSHEELVGADPEFFTLQEFPGATEEIAPGAAAPLTVAFTPDSQREFLANVTLESNDPAAPFANVPLKGTGLERTPVAVPQIGLINGAVPAPNQLLRALDDILLDGANSTPGRRARPITSFHWDLVSKPDTSTATLTASESPQTGFSFNSSGATRPGLDVIGTFVVRLTVTDSAGQRNANDGLLTLETRPGAGIHVQLTWEDSKADIDLHLVRTGNIGGAFSQDDCYYVNCTGPDGLDWGGGNRNAFLDVDDTDGFGPENTRVPGPSPVRSYLVGIHFFARHGGGSDVNVRVKVFLEGQLVEDARRTMSQCDSFWTVGVVNPGNMRWEPSGDMTQVMQGGCSGE